MLYLFTFGVWGAGWLYDAIHVRSLVQQQRPAAAASASAVNVKPAEPPHSVLATPPGPATASDGPSPAPSRLLKRTVQVVSTTYVPAAPVPETDPIPAEATSGALDHAKADNGAADGGVMVTSAEDLYAAERELERLREDSKRQDLQIQREAEEHRRRLDNARRLIEAQRHQAETKDADELQHAADVAPVLQQQAQRSVHRVLEEDAQREGREARSQRPAQTGSKSSSPSVSAPSSPARAAAWAAVPSTPPPPTFAQPPADGPSPAATPSAFSYSRFTVAGGRPGNAQGHEEADPSANGNAARNGGGINGNGQSHGRGRKGRGGGRR